MITIRKITFGDLFHILLIRRNFLRINQIKKDYSFMCHDNGIKAFILVSHEHFNGYQDKTIPRSVLEFWKEHSYKVLDIYSNEQFNNDFPYVENTFDELVKNMHLGDILWAKPTSIVKIQSLKRLGFIYNEDDLIYSFQKS